MADVEFTKAEDAYFESGGENPLPSEDTAPEPGAAEPEAPVAEAAPPADLEDDEPETVTDGEGKSELISKKAFIKERARRKQAEAKAAEADAKAFRLADEWRKHAISQPPQQPQMPQQPAPEPFVMPDPEQDPIGYIKALGKANEIMAQEVIQTRQQTQQQNEVRSVVQTYQQDAAVARQQAPDFDATYEAFKTHKQREIAASMVAFGRTPDKASVTAAFNNFEYGLITNAMKAGRRPSEAVYYLAKQTLQYAPPAQAQAAPPASQPDRLEQIERAQTANRSLSNVGSSATKTGTSAERVANMSQKEFEAWYAKVGPDGFAETFSG